jgi:osmotically-inducible protein OsmY
MAQSAVGLILPTHEPTGAGRDASQGTAPFQGQRQGDLRLAERIKHAFRRSGYGPMRGFEVTSHERLVILSSRVPRYYLKLVAQTIAQAVPGVHQVRNEPDVGLPS